MVVVFAGTECPINNAYMPRLGELHKQYSPKGVQFLAVNANVQDTPGPHRAHAKKNDVPFPVLKDTANRYRRLPRAGRQKFLCSIADE